MAPSPLGRRAGARRGRRGDFAVLGPRRAQARAGSAGHAPTPAARPPTRDSRRRVSAIPSGDCRLDVWLWRARFFKTRALAAQFLEGGRLRVIRPGAEPVRIDKASRTVRPGDRLLFAQGGRILEIEVKAFGERRGPASEARALYHQTLGH